LGRHLARWDTSNDLGPNASDLRKKLSDVAPKFFDSPAMENDAWKQSNRANRHIVVKFSTHGYHHVICETRHFHDVNENCVCKLCGDKCDLYHAGEFRNVGSLSQLEKLYRMTGTALLGEDL